MDTTTLATMLDRWESGRGPLYSQLAGAITSLAESGALEPGCRLPSERALASGLHVSRNTVAAAYQQLRDDGWIESRPGAAPTIGARARGVDAMTLHQRFASILPQGEESLVRLNDSTPPPAPAVTRVLESAAGPALWGADATGYAPLGRQGLVEAVVERLRADGIAAEPDEVVITSGAQQAVWLALAVVGCSGQTAVEALTYPGVFDAMDSAESSTIALPFTHEGLDVGAATRLIRANRPSLVYLTTFHNPTGTVLAEADAVRVLEAAAEAGSIVVDDRVTADLVLAGERPRAFASLGTGASVLTISSMSKVFWGGLRTGWLHVNRTLAEHLRYRKAAMDFGNPVVLQDAATTLLDEHFDETVAWRSAQLAESLAAVREALAEVAPAWRYTVPSGGPNLWVEVPGADADAFAARAGRAGAPVIPGTTFEVTDGPGRSRFRLPFYLPPEELRRGVKMLATAA